eukprot:6204033-Pleurochrysis_carterae.AAC.3
MCPWKKWHAKLRPQLQLACTGRRTFANSYATQSGRSAHATRQSMWRLTPQTSSILELWAPRVLHAPLCLAACASGSPWTTSAPGMFQPSSGRQPWFCAAGIGGAAATDSRQHPRQSQPIRVMS